MNIGMLKELIMNIPDDYNLKYGPKEIPVRNLIICTEDKEIIVR